MNERQFQACPGGGGGGGRAVPPVWLHRGCAEPASSVLLCFHAAGGVIFSQSENKKMFSLHSWTLSSPNTHRCERSCRKGGAEKDRAAPGLRTEPFVQLVCATRIQMMRLSGSLTCRVAAPL